MIPAFGEILPLWYAKVCASPPLSSTHYGLQRHQGAYDGKYGAPSAGAPKVFVKYFYVNTATGEKSGEMMGVATLSSSEEDGD